MADRLEGKVAVVTGAAPRGEGVGNGMAVAMLFAREGAKVVLVNRSAERAEKLAKQIKEAGGEAAVFAGDVAKADVCEAMADFTAKKYGRLDILHNNVGIGAPGTPETVTLENWNKVLEANLTTIKDAARFAPEATAGRNIPFGVREHAMGSIMNGIALHGCLIPYGGTFLVFSDYMRPAIRLAALMHQRVIYVFTHDSIGLGEDGPTHQPIEHLTALRCIPNLTVLRPGDAAETAEAWRIAVQHTWSYFLKHAERERNCRTDRSCRATRACGGRGAARPRGEDGKGTAQGSWRAEGAGAHALWRLGAQGDRQRFLTPAPPLRRCKNPTG